MISAPNMWMAAWPPSFLLQVHIEHLLCARHCVTCGLNVSPQDHTQGVECGLKSPSFISKFYPLPLYQKWPSASFWGVGNTCTPTGFWPHSTFHALDNREGILLTLVRIPFNTLYHGQRSVHFRGNEYLPIGFWWLLSGNNQGTPIYKWGSQMISLWSHSLCSGVWLYSFLPAFAFFKVFFFFLFFF